MSINVPNTKAGLRSKFLWLRVKIATKLFALGKKRSNDFPLSTAWKFRIKLILLKLLALDQGFYIKNNNFAKYEIGKNTIKNPRNTLLIDGQCLKNDTYSRGIGRFTLSLAKNIALVRPDLEVIIFLTNYGDLGNLPKLNLFIRQAKLKNLKLKIFDIFENENVLPAILAIERLANEIKSTNVRQLIIPSHFEHPLDAIPLDLIELENTKVSIVIHDLIPLYFKELLPTAKIRNLYLQKIDLLRFADKILTVSDYTKKSIQATMPSLPKTKIHTIGAAGYFEFKKNPYKLSARRGILCIAADTPHKNVFKLIDSYAELDESVQSLHPLIICGLSKGMRNLISEKQRFTKVKIITKPKISDLELRDLYRKSRIVVIPSLMEGFGMPAIEAWANETVALGGMNTVLQETISNKSLLFNPNDVSSIASVMNEVLINDDLWTQSLRDSKRELSVYSWTSVAQKLLKQIKL